jgi:endoglucanase
MQDRHFRLIQQAGFNHVRINLHPFEFLGTAPGYEIHPSWLEKLDWAVEQALKNNLTLSLDLHEFTAMGADPFGLKPRFLAAWDQLSRHFKNSPPAVFFELLNEPNKALTPALWNEFLKEPYEIVRQTNPERTLIIGPAFWNGIDHLADLLLPEADRSIIVTVHYYHPMPFTHQGAHWSEHRDRVGVEWSGTVEDQNKIIGDLGGVQGWAEQHQRPILLGEFGAYDQADMASRVRYTSFMARQAEKLGWSWSYWQFDSDFILYDIDNDAWVNPILNALIPAA